jgi:hypothetical protein
MSRGGSRAGQGFDRWTVAVVEGVVSLIHGPGTRAAGATGDVSGAQSADGDAPTDAKAVRALAHTVPGVVAVRLAPTGQPVPAAAEPANAAVRARSPVQQEETS